MPQTSASKWWYLLPIFFVWMGGLAMFLILRKEDNETAKWGLIIGSGLTGCYMAVGYLSMSFLR